MTIRLTQLSHKGGCGCKIAPAVLQTLLPRSAKLPTPNLLVGHETSDDAAVYQINPEQAIVATTDFFMPIVDDPYDFGAIAATNAISDIYAMGGKPLFALALVGMPLQSLPTEVIQAILRGGEETCARAGIPVAGGHSIDSLEPIYGLAVTGMVHPRNVKRNCGAKVGDKLVLGKPLGVGVYCAAVKKALLGPADYETLLSVVTRLNTPGIDLALLPGVHAMTDVTGFGLLGHLHELCAGSSVGAVLNMDALPLLPNARELISQGFVTGASASNWQTYQASVVNGENLDPLLRTLITDPQTSGGLLVACSDADTAKVLDTFHEAGFSDARVIGECISGPATIHLR